MSKLQGEIATDLQTMYSSGADDLNGVVSQIKEAATVSDLEQKKMVLLHSNLLSLHLFICYLV